MPEVAPQPRSGMQPAWRAAALAYRSARGEGKSDHASHLAARTAVSALHPALSERKASAEAVNAVAYASSFHADWFWAPLRKKLDADQAS